MIVVDASTWVDYLAGRLANHHRLMILQDEPVSPPHVDFEVGSALLRLERRGVLMAGSARALTREFAQMPFLRERDPLDQVSAFEMMHNATYADALYLALAERQDCPVLTSDAGMAECARIAGVDVVTTRQ